MMMVNEIQASSLKCATGLGVITSVLMKFRAMAKFVEVDLSLHLPVSPSCPLRRMRAFHLHRLCPALRGPALLRLPPRIGIVAPFHSTRIAANDIHGENSETAAKRGRKKKTPAPPQEEAVAEPTTTTQVAEIVPIKIVKPRKRAPKISDITRLIPSTPLNPAPPRPLRPYQEECVDTVLEAIEQGKRRLGISLATGAGKTVIFTNLIGKVQLADAKRYQTIILVHRRELVEQAARHCVEVYPDKVPNPDTNK
jgi:Type III restriction enzyme, res subunit